MFLSETQLQNLRQLLEKGVVLSREKLEKMTGIASWQGRVEQLEVLSSKALLTAPAKKPSFPCRSFYLYMPGGAFSVIFPQESSSLIAKAYLKQSGLSESKIKNIEEKSLDEMSNILVNNLIEPLADASKMSFFISVPEKQEGAYSQIYESACRRFTQNPSNEVALAQVHLTNFALSIKVDIFLNSGFFEALFAAAAAS